jgi:hypothetical protein
MAYSFTVANSQFLTTSSSPVSSMPLTMALWFRTPNATLSTARVLCELRAPTTYYVYRLAIAANATPIRATAIGSANSANPNSAAVATAGISANTWSHAVGVFASSTSRTVYFNGGNSATDTVSITPLNVSQICIGGGTNTIVAGPPDGFFFDGQIAEVGLWNAALTVAEVLSLSRGMSCNLVRPQSLMFHAPLIRDLVDVRGGRSITNNGSATVSAHPRVYAA